MMTQVRNAAMAEELGSRSIEERPPSIVPIFAAIRRRNARALEHDGVRRNRHTAKSDSRIKDLSASDRKAGSILRNAL
jgi:hypothetical protein